MTVEEYYFECNFSIDFNGYNIGTSILQMIKTKFHGVKAYYLLTIKVVKCVFWIYIFDKFFIVKKESFCPSIPLAPKFENVWHWGEQRLCCAQTLKVRRINVVKNGNGWWGRKVENRLNTYVFGRVHVLVFTSTCTCTFIHNSLRFMYSSWTSPFSCILLSDKKNASEFSIDVCYHCYDKCVANAYSAVQKHTMVDARPGEGEGKIFCDDITQGLTILTCMCKELTEYSINIL